MKAGLYARVSTDEQEPENQLIELRRFAKARGYEPVEFIDKGYSGSLEADKRPALTELMLAAQKHKIQAVIVWDFSRFARSMKQLVVALDQFREWKVDFISYREGIDTVGSTGRLMFGIFAALAEFERALIRERVIAGLKRARSQGKILGRRRKDVDPQLIYFYALSKEKPSLREMERYFGVSRMTISRILSQKPSKN